MAALAATDLAIEGPKLIATTRFEDARGYFAETFNRRQFCEAIGSEVQFVQDNESLSTMVGTVRGLHFQIAPAAQGKLVRVSAGKVIDVVVDLRTDSATFGHHVTVELDAAGGDQLWVPEGFAHGFCTLVPGTVVSYKVTTFYQASADRSLNWRDPQLGIVWPIDVDQAVLSEKDAGAPTLAQLKEQDSVF